MCEEKKSSCYMCADCVEEYYNAWNDLHYRLLTGASCEFVDDDTKGVLRNILDMMDTCEERYLNG